MLRRLLRPLWSPREGFLDFAADAPALPRSLGWMLAAALPWCVASTWLGGKQALADYTALRAVQGPTWDAALRLAPDLSCADLQQAFAAWPAPPAWAHLAPWTPLLALLGLLGFWLHDGVWDHAALWLLRGLKADKAGRVKATLAAEAQAQAVGWIGTALGLLAFLPGAGGWVGLALSPLTVWLWLLRGWALSAHHGCPPWKGVAATILHLILFGLFLVITVAVPLLAMLALMAAG